MEEEIKNTNDAEKKADGKTKRDVLKKTIIGLVIFVAVLIVFGMGIFVGEMKARFSYQWAENYHLNFGGPPGGFMGNLRIPPPPDNEFIQGHGTFGQIIEIGDNDFVIKGQDNVEKIIAMSSGTIIQKGREMINKEGLKVNDNIIVIGSPKSDGQIEAKLIRIFNQPSNLQPYGLQNN